MSFCDAPNVKCPKCGQEFELLDADKYDEGSYCVCPECDAELFCDEVETQRTWFWSEVRP